MVTQTCGPSIDALCRSGRADWPDLHDLPVLTVTLDTDTVRDLWENDARSAAVRQLIEMSRTGIVDLAVTRHIEEDIPRRPLADQINRLPQLGIQITGGVFVLGVSRLGGSDGLGSDA